MGSELTRPLLLGDFTERGAGDADGVFLGGGEDGGAMVAPSIPDTAPSVTSTSSSTGPRTLPLPPLGVRSSAVPHTAQKRALEEVCWPHEVQNMEAGFYHRVRCGW
ncbi:MAG: hypothetical protein ABSG69_15625 [Candidatus Acidiferrum sp.]